jgi:hypothetical protein
MWELSSLRDLEWVSVGLLACVYNAWARRRDDGVQLCSCFIGIALASNFLQKTGAGVYNNAQFDLIIAVAMGFGLRSHKFRYGLSRALFGRDKLKQFYCLSCACGCWCQSNFNR